MFIDDILITGSSEEEHLKNLEEVLSRLQAHGVQLKKEKCSFMKKSVEYLGHQVDVSGIKATPEKSLQLKMPLYHRMYSN